MIKRYEFNNMSSIFDHKATLRYMLTVESEVVSFQAKHNFIPDPKNKLYRAMNQIYISDDFVAVMEINESKSKHDVIAFVDTIEQIVKRIDPTAPVQYLHFGLTSSDVKDTALALQLVDGFNVLDTLLDALEENLQKVWDSNILLSGSGRTHGQFAESYKYADKINSFVSELQRLRESLKITKTNARYGKISGPLGNNRSIPDYIEDEILSHLGLENEVYATQVIPRDRHLRVFHWFSLLGAFLERISTEFRLLSHQNVGEVYEYFEVVSQKGSSSMPHKRNPINLENLCGAARILQGYVSSAERNCVLWHERDISHSVVERINIPDAFHLAATSIKKLTDTVSRLEFDRIKIESNRVEGGKLFAKIPSNHILMALIRSGLNRSDAYAVVKDISTNNFINCIYPPKFPYEDLKRSIDETVIKLGLEGQVEEIYLHE